MGMAGFFSGLSIHVDSVCRRQQPQLPPSGGLQSETALYKVPYQDYLAHLLLIQLHAMNAPGFLAPGTSASAHASHLTPAFLYTCRFFILHCPSQASPRAAQVMIVRSSSAKSVLLSLDSKQVLLGVGAVGCWAGTTQEDRGARVSCACARCLGRERLRWPLGMQQGRETTIWGEAPRVGGLLC